MKTVKALKAFSDGELSMYDGEIRDIDETKATQYIAEGYVEEYSGGGGITPTGKKTITDTTETDVTNYATAQVVDEDLVAGNIKKDVNILGVVGTYEGSGGGSFTPATLTIINQTGVNVSLYAPLFAENGGTYGVEAADTGTYVVVIGGLGAMLQIPDPNYTISVVDGDITSVGTGKYLMTGNGTLKIETGAS